MQTAIIGLGSLGLIFGLLLGIASKLFHVEVDERIEKIDEILPGSNCGACGYAGCIGLAEAIVKGKVEPDACIPGGEEVMEKICDIMGKKGTQSTKKVAFLKCKGSNIDTKDIFLYSGIKDCKAAQLVSGGFKACEYGCLGYGTCEKVCPFDAIFVNEETGLVEINEEKCTGCGKCIKECPRNVLSLVPCDSKVRVTCNSEDKGAKVKKICERGCIGCRICQKVCPFDAVTITNNIAYIDYSLCRNCNLCYEKCPVKVIDSNVTVTKKAFVIEENCIGCSICKKVCPKDAVEGEPKKPFSIITSKCIGCEICYEKCPKKAIEMKEI
ncbi:MAG: RnfABCDGE type electron transport complex subunit B [Candidatus Muiribacteriota bacterium]